MTKTFDYEFDNDDTITVDGVDFKYSEIIDFIDDLEYTSYFFKVIVIYNRELREKLERLGVIETNIRGGSARGPNYENFAKIINDIYENL